MFGGSDDREICALAAAYGAAIAAAGHITLSGGTHADSTPVKHAAISGAKEHPWVGVAQEDPAVGVDLGKQGFVLPTGLGHRRNFLEAHVCHAAIALPGGCGTMSEAASCLFLRRPVTFVGPDWTKEYDLDAPDRAAVADRMARRTFKRFGLDENQTDPDFGFTQNLLSRRHRIDEALLLRRLDGSPRDHRELPSAWAGRPRR